MLIHSVHSELLPAMSKIPQAVCESGNEATGTSGV
jgi:hypothetical protein